MYHDSESITCRKLSGEGCGKKKEFDDYSYSKHGKEISINREKQSISLLFDI